MPPSLDEETTAVLRFPQINQRMWYRVLEIAQHRGELPMRVWRLGRFLSQQELDPATGSVIGQWDTGRVDGGMGLAHGYALTEGFGDDRFWDDLKEVYRAGFAEQVVKPAPGRRAVYALSLRVDAIPGDLPDDLMRQLKVWDLPDVEVRHEDARYGRLAASEPAAMAEPAAIAVDEQAAAQLAAEPRWEHPAGSPAAAVAADIRTAAKALGKEAGPKDLRCWAVAERDRAEALTQRVMSNGKTSPSYAKEFLPLSGLSSTGSSELSWSNRMEQAKAKATPSAAATRTFPGQFGGDLSVVADRVLRRAWHSWRVQLGYGKVLLPSGSWDEFGQWHSASAWSDLQRTVRIALRRSTESELVEVLSSKVAGVDDVGKLAAWRLWRLINSRKDAHGYGRRRDVPQAAHVTAWDEAEAAERDRIRLRAAQVRVAQEREEEARRVAAAAERAEQSERWNLKRWSRELEYVHQQEQESRHRIERPAGPRSADSVRAAALARARAEKRSRRRG